MLAAKNLDGKSKEEITQWGLLIGDVLKEASGKGNVLDAEISYYGAIGNLTLGQAEEIADRIRSVIQSDETPEILVKVEAFMRALARGGAAA